MKKHFALVLSFILSYNFISYASADSYTTQSNPPSWGLDRIDQRSQEVDDKYQYFYDGSGVDIYVLDSGINTGHVDFTGRIKTGISYTSDTVEDCHGHGTHVSGIAAGSTHGVAKGANIIPVKILDCNKNGSIFDVIAAVDWVIAQHDSSRTAVMNLSFASGSFVPTLNAKLVDAIADNIVVVAGAGNSSADAANYSPSGEPAVLTVAGATQGNNDGNGVFPTSNYGSVVDLWAPSSYIVSAWKGSSTATKSATGTSQAAPFVSGVAAMAIEQYPNYSAQQIMDLILSTATQNALPSVPAGTTSKMIYSLLNNTLQESVVTTTTVPVTTTTTVPATTTTTVPVTTTTIVVSESTTTTVPVTTTVVLESTTTTTQVPVTTTTTVVPETTTTTTTVVPETTTTTVVKTVAAPSSGGGSSGSGGSSQTTTVPKVDVPTSTVVTVQPTPTTVPVVQPVVEVLPVKIVDVVVDNKRKVKKLLCFKGKVLRRIVGFNPKCPSGFAVKSVSVSSANKKQKVNRKD